MKEIVIITDMGEECDDEVTIASVFKFAASSNEFNFTIFCTDPNWGEIITDLGFSNTVNVKFLPIENIEGNLPTSFDLLQIGPVDDESLSTHFIYKTYNYYLVGAFGTTNSKGKAESFARNLYKYATNKYIIVTKNKNGVLAPPFNINVINTYFPDNEYLKELVLRIGFRNTVGRADPTVGKFVAHLVSEPNGANYNGGANYNTVKQQLEKLDIEPIIPGQDAIDIAKKYVTELEKGPIAFNGKNSIDGPFVTTDSVKNGYAYILQNLNKLYNVPIEFYSSGSPRNWNRLWKDFSDNEKLEQAFVNFQSKNIEVPDLPLTPAYDCIGLLAVLANNYDKLNKYFKIQSNDLISESIDIYTLIDTISNPNPNILDSKSKSSFGKKSRRKRSLVRRRRKKSKRSRRRRNSKKRSSLKSRKRKSRRKRKSSKKYIRKRKSGTRKVGRKF